MIKLRDMVDNHCQMLQGAGPQDAVGEVRCPSVRPRTSAARLTLRLEHPKTVSRLSRPSHATLPHVGYLR
jgi:hypothetical protein